MKAVEDGLRRLDGVDRLVTDLQANLVTITPARRIAPDLAAIPKTIEAAGFRPGRMWITALGRPEALAGGGEGFRIAGWPTVLPLAGPMVIGRGEIEAEVVIDSGAVRLRAVGR